MARLLLCPRLKLVLLFAVSSSTPACILPVSPEFQDPPGAPNAAPEISGPNFFPGSQVANTMMQTFSFRISDPNNETLYVRWAADAVPFVPNISRLLEHNTAYPPSADGQPKEIDKIIYCTDLSGMPTHQIIGAVADSPFREGDNDYLALEGPGKESFVVWTLTLICPSQASP